jgi:hypothetical protein
MKDALIVTSSIIRCQQRSDAFDRLVPLTRQQTTWGDAFGYILTKVDFHSFPRYDYVSRTSLGEMTGEILIEKWLELIRGSARPDGR